MSARDDLLDEFGRAEAGTAPWTLDELRQRVAEIRAEGLAEAEAIAERHKEKHFQYGNTDQGHGASGVANSIRIALGRTTATTEKASTTAPPAGASTPLGWARALGAEDLHSLMSELSAALLGYWHDDPDAEVLARVESVLAEHRSQASEAAQATASEGGGR